MDGQRWLPAEMGRELAHSMAQDLGRELDPIAAAGSLRFRSLHAIGGTRPEPWVMDANELYGAIVHTTRTGKPNLLARAASAGIITWYIAEHAANEVEEHLDEWATEAHIDAAAAWDTWEQKYRPMLRLVQGDLTEIAFTEPERQRLDDLAIVDPDDLPSARLAIALGARLATRDGALLRATYGPGRTSGDHAEALIPTAGALNASGQLREMEALGVLLPAVLIAELASLIRRVPLVGLVGAGAAAIALRVPERRDRLRASALRGWSAVATALEVWVAVHLTINEQLARFEPVLGSVDVAVEELGADARPRIAMWALARRGDGDASAADLAAAWPSAALHLRSVAAIRLVLHAGEVFAETGRGRFQLGVPLRASEKLSAMEGIR